MASICKLASCRTGAKRYALGAVAEKASPTGTANPVPVTLTIGDASGTISVNAHIDHYATWRRSLRPLPERPRVR
jgi:hypothetical protein